MRSPAPDCKGNSTFALPFRPKANGETGMRQDEKRKAEVIVKKRRLAAKGLKARSDGKPVDPLADVESLDADDKRPLPEDTEAQEEEIAGRALPAAAALRRSG